MGTHFREVIVIQALIHFKIDGQVEQRFVQYSPTDQVQRDQQAANPAISIQKGVDGFKLIMRDTDANEFRYVNVFIVKNKLHRSLINSFMY